MELDSITGRIARLLYPQAEVAVTGYESTEYADNSYDVVMGNIPFNSIRIYDGRYNDMDCLIHDYFFVRSLDLVKPGGIIAFITSAGTLDKRDGAINITSQSLFRFLSSHFHSNVLPILTIAHSVNLFHSVESYAIISLG